MQLFDSTVKIEKKELGAKKNLKKLRADCKRQDGQGRLKKFRAVYQAVEPTLELKEFLKEAKKLKASIKAEFNITV